MISRLWATIVAAVRDSGSRPTNATDRGQRLPGGFDLNALGLGWVRGRPAAGSFAVRRLLDDDDYSDDEDLPDEDGSDEDDSDEDDPAADDIREDGDTVADRNGLSTCTKVRSRI